MNWGPIVGEIASWLTSLGITGLFAATTAWGLFKWLGNRWIEDHFSKELESFKSEKQVELENLRTEYGRETERLKADLNRFADRASRFHVREYEVLPEAWGLMNKAFGKTSTAISSFQQHPNLNQMGDSQFEAWLDQSGLEQYQQDELKSCDDKNKHYMTLQNWAQISDAKSAVIEFTNYVILQGIFIDEALSLKMMNAGENMHKAITSRSMGEQMKTHLYRRGETDFWMQAQDEIETVGPVVLEVKQEIRQHLANIRLEGN